MNKIIQTLTKDFANEQQFDEAMDQATAFENFAAYLTIGSYVESTLDPQKCVLGNDGQPAVDAIGIIVNGVLINSTDDIDTYAEINKYLDVDFIIVQAKTSETFDVSRLGHIGDFCEQIFTTGPSEVDNEQVNNFFELKEYIYKHVKFFKRRNPNLHLYYVTTGQSPKNDRNFQNKESLIRNRMTALSLFDDVKVNLVGVTEIQKLSRQMSNSLRREIVFPKKVTLPDIPDVDQAFLGVLPAKEFLTLIEGENGNILSSIFYDNVRDWQGLNDVNEGMKKTVEDGGSKAKFVLMNNGITIIAKKIQQTGEKVVIEDYQVVNGCQTSNILWQCRASLDESVMVPLRLVATENDNVVEDIIRATNSQTEVVQTQLLAVTSFQKQLELYFQTHNSNSLYYERRSRQFSDKAVEKSRIITPINLIKAFSSMFLAAPHNTARDFGSVLKKVGTDIFHEKHKLEPYFFAALCLFWLDSLIKKGKINKSVRIARYHVLLAVRIIYEKDELPAPSANKISGYVNKMLPLFKDAATAENTLKAPVNLVLKLIKDKTSDEVRTSNFTQQVTAAALKARAK